MEIAVLSDDALQTATILEVLQAAGHVCHAYKDGQELLAWLRRETAHMVILDWRVADASAAEVGASMRQKSPVRIPLLCITDCAGGADIDAALALGVDDYLIKPLRRGELLTRVQAQLRRAWPHQPAAPWISFDDYAFEVQGGQLTNRGATISVTRKEFALALLLFQNLGQPLSRATILDTVWPDKAEVPTRSMDTHISRVRSKLGLRPEHGFRLAPVYSYGYLLERIDR
jgi:DNA-binding response OmpR family regulator